MTIMFQRLKERVRFSPLCSELKMIGNNFLSQWNWKLKSCKNSFFLSEVHYRCIELGRGRGPQLAYFRIGRPARLVSFFYAFDDFWSYLLDISFNLLFRLTRLVFLHCSFPQNLKSSGLQVYLHFPSWRWKSMETPWSDFLWDPCFMNIFLNCIPLSPLSGPEIQPQLCPLLGKFRLCQSQASPRSPSLLSNSPSSS